MKYITFKRSYVEAYEVAMQVEEKGFRSLIKYDPSLHWYTIYQTTGIRKIREKISRCVCLKFCDKKSYCNYYIENKDHSDFIGCSDAKSYAKEEYNVIKEV